jgi:hypothetical protein
MYYLIFNKVNKERKVPHLFFSKIITQNITLKKTLLSPVTDAHATSYCTVHTDSSSDVSLKRLELQQIYWIFCGLLAVNSRLLVSQPVLLVIILLMKHLLGLHFFRYFFSMRKKPRYCSATIPCEFWWRYFQVKFLLLFNNKKSQDIGFMCSEIHTVFNK